MPAKIQVKKKSAARSRGKPKTNGASKTKHDGADVEKLRQEAAAAQKRLAQLETRIANDGDQLRAVQNMLTTREVEIEAARAEAQDLREQLRAARTPAAAGAMECPRCGARMIELTLESVRADKCNGCHGIFLDNGELEVVLEHHDRQRDKGIRHWYSGLFGRK